ncbi:MAG: LON peptidase substrate-binding domain-containing protein, partial [bacterium]
MSNDNGSERKPGEDPQVEKKSEPTHYLISGPGDEEFNVPSVLPMLPVRDVVVYPGVTVPLAIGRRKSLAALAQAGHDGYMLLVTQHDAELQDPTIDDVYRVGTIVRVLRIIDARGEGKQALVAGIARAKLGREVSTEPQALVAITPLEDLHIDGTAAEGAWRRVVMLAQRVIELREDLPDEWKLFIAGIPAAGMLADLVASNLPLTPEQRMELLEEPDPAERLRLLEAHL